MNYEYLPSKYASYNCIYFLRTQTGVVPMPQNYDEMEILPEHFEYGLLNGHTLVMLDQIINNVSQFNQSIILDQNIYIDYFH